VFYKIQETRIQGTRFLSNLSLLNYFIICVNLFHLCNLCSILFNVTSESLPVEGKEER
jgi:hypothetical protein